VNKMDEFKEGDKVFAVVKVYNKNKKPFIWKMVEAFYHDRSPIEEKAGDTHILIRIGNKDQSILHIDKLDVFPSAIEAVYAAEKRNLLNYTT
jgi:hypothetical protein